MSKKEEYKELSRCYDELSGFWLKQEKQIKEIEGRLSAIRKLAQKIKECQESQCVLAPERITPNCPNMDCECYWDLTEELAVLLKEEVGKE